MPPTPLQLGGVGLAWHSCRSGPPQPWHTLGTPARGSQGPGWARPPYPWSLVPVHVQRRHSRPTTRSSKSTWPPPHLAQPPAPEVSAGPARSASPARCQAWPRATRHPALPRVSAAAPIRDGGLCPVTAIVTQGHYVPQRTVGDYWGGRHWHLVGRDLLNTLRCSGWPHSEE